jgi:hypothetical protein
MYGGDDNTVRVNGVKRERERERERCFVPPLEAEWNKFESVELGV